MFKKVYSTQINVVASFTASIWNALLSILCVPLYLHYLDIEVYGLIGFFTSVQSLTTLLDLGISPAFSRELARLSTSQRNAQEMHNIQRTLEVPNWVSAAFIAVLLSVLSPVFAAYWVQPKNLSPDIIARSMIIMSVNVAIQFSSNFYIGGLMGLQKQVVLNAINIICGTLRSIGALFVLAFISSDIESFLIWQTIIAVLQIILMAFTLKFSLPTPLSKPSFQKKLFSSIWRFAAGMTGISIVSLILLQSDKFILSRMLDLQSFGYYSLAFTISGMAMSMITSSITHAVYPRFSQLVSIDDQKKLIEIYHRSCQIMSSILLPVAMILVIYSYEILLVWMRKEEIADNTYILLSLVALGTGLNGVMWLPYYLQLAHGWTKLAFNMNVAAIVILIPIMVFGVTKYGAIGGVTTWVLINSFYIIVTIQLMHRKILKDEKWKWYIKDLGIPLLVSFTVAVSGRLFLNGSVNKLEIIVKLMVISFITLLSTSLSTTATRDIIWKMKGNLTNFTFRQSE